MIHLPAVIDTLRELYGPAPQPRVRDPLQLILLENVAYLVDDARRAKAYALLKRTVGVTAAAIAVAPLGALLEVTSAGIVAEQQAEKLQRIAHLTLDEFGGDLRPVLALPTAAAKRALRKFPGIGEPGAEKILLFCHALPVLALDSNGLRVLLRIGFGTEARGYSATYRSVQQAVAAELPDSCDWLVEAHLLLRRHGQELCKRSSPSCEVCPLAPRCGYARGRRAGVGC